MYVCTYVHTYISNVHVRAYVRTYVHMYVCMYAVCIRRVCILNYPHDGLHSHIYNKHAQNETINGTQDCGLIIQ